MEYASTAQFGDINILHAAFVEEYIEATGASWSPTVYGAHKCPMLGRDLSALHRQGRLTRWRMGVGGSESGFPKWVFEYEI